MPFLKLLKKPKSQPKRPVNNQRKVAISNKLTTSRLKVIKIQRKLAKAERKLADARKHLK